MAGPTPDVFRLDGKVVLITGGAGGLGSATAHAMARAGAAVVAFDRDPEALASLAAAFAENGEQARLLTIEGDGNDAADIAGAFQRAEEELGPVDVLVNTAFVLRLAAPELLSLEDWEVTANANITGYFLFAQEAGRRMIARGSGGCILNISSIAATNAVGRRSFAYSIAKAAVNMMTMELAVEWAKHGIRVNAVQPAQVMTPGLRKRIATHPFDEQTMGRILGGIPMNRMGEPEEIADPLVFLASDAARFITGACLPVDGGNLAMNAGGSHTYS
jgi:NAD(P)-dependent dehydrogenase (short-subunit alcohol dehydrogenase family)